jgi:GLPGLI family protein
MQLSFFGTTSYDASLLFNKSQSLFEYKENFPDNESVEQVEDSEGNIKINYHNSFQKYIRCNREKNLIRESNGYFEKKVPYLIEESIPVIAWNISEETKKINQYDCYKATCSFKGRNYSVWFTPDIQTGFGPIKLNGLPGLILEVSDDTKEVVLYAQAITMEEKMIENEPLGLNVISLSEYKKKNAKMLQDLEETGKRISSKMNRGFKVSFKMSQPKAIEMDYDLAVPEK